MARIVQIIVACACVVAVSAIPSGKSRSAYSYPFNFVARESWGARPPNGATPLSLPVPYVVVHHSYIPPDCVTEDTCKHNMRLMQDMHQLVNGWQDIGYNFAVGGEGSVYEGRGWENVGAHAVSYNVKSIGICMIGDFVENLPPQAQMESLKKLIATGVELGYISPNYKLIGHRQVSATECPGHALFNEISTWDNFTPAL
ncbi:hypothetical protein HW555_013900 [Spodoptera exigua]|uniref:Peptidoglycan-recognition protein n=1 Tax=Spodoptera exigua TaxID=7107 RepID=A0A835G0M6_SPOEX|nr:hypothetical protein HW555_013900 [Spodoptera exigua]